MSVFTVVERSELEPFLAGYAVGTLRNFSGISAGIENSNYFVSAGAGEYILTLFERTPATELPFFLALMAHLAAHNLPSARPLADNGGCYLGELKGRPAALVARLPGTSVARPGVEHCAAIGRVMAHMHLASLEFAPQRENDRGHPWRAAVSNLVAARLDTTDQRLLEESIDEFRDDPFIGLPGGVIHADLFRDNALFDAGRLTGIIDFYYACSGAFVYDLAVAFADWCFDEDKLVLHRSLAAAMLTAYADVRPLLRVERDAWMGALRAVGLRFWLSRLNDHHFPREGVLTYAKDPEAYKRILLHGRGRPDDFEKLWR